MTTAKHRFRKARATGAAATVNKAGDILVGKITPKGETQLTREEKLLRAEQLDTLTLLEAGQLSKMLQEKWGVSAAAPAAAAAKKAGNARDTSLRKATTFRLDPTLQAGLAVLGQVLKTPLNRLVNEAVRRFIEKRSAEVEADLERTLERLKACREKDPRFESAIAQFVEAEASLGHDDPMEGTPRPAAGPAQTKVRELLRG